MNAPSRTVGKTDEKGLVKPMAFVVLCEGFEPSDETAETLKAFVRDGMAKYKYPRWIRFVEALPKSTTGKIQRFKLRED